MSDPTKSVHTGVDPLTNEPSKYNVKPASNTIRIYPMKKPKRISRKTANGVARDWTPHKRHLTLHYNRCLGLFVRTDAESSSGQAHPTTQAQVPPAGFSVVIPPSPQAASAQAATYSGGTSSADGPTEDAVSIMI